MNVIGAVELGSTAILALYVAAGRGEGVGRTADAAILAAGAWIGEEICIRGYGAYAYAPGWRFWLDRMPLAVVLIWPAVILSGRAVARLLGERRLPLWTGLVVWFDASLIEPVATHAGLWHWNLPGPFGVPLIGPIGWGCYAAAGVFFIQGPVRSSACALRSSEEDSPVTGEMSRSDRGGPPPAEEDRGGRASGRGGLAPLWTAWLECPRPLLLARLQRGWRPLGALLAPILAHGLILAFWWGALRWVASPWPEGAAAAAGLALCAMATALALRARRHGRLPWREAVPRAGAAALFFALLGIRPDGLLALFAVAFSPPYLALLPSRAARPMPRGG